MAVKIDQLNGYIADNPNIDFERCDGTVFSYDEVNTASMTNNSNVITINGGQGNFPLAYIETDKTQEITFTSSEFTMDMFAMANAGKTEEGDVGTQETKRFEVEDGLKIVIPYETQKESVKIRGLAAGEAAAAGTYAVEVTTAGADTAGSTTITLNEADATKGDTIRVSYRRRVVDAHTLTVKTNGTTAKGALYLHWPVYSSGSDCTESAIKGWLHMYIPRVRVTALPGFDNSYKSAATNGVTFSAIDAKRADGKLFDLNYEPLDADGNIIAKSANEAVDWD